MIMNGFNVVAYGLPFTMRPYSTAGNWVFVENLLEPAIARMYLLEHKLFKLQQEKPFHRHVDKIEAELGVHVRRLGEFILDYLTLAAIGENRHTHHSPSRFVCPICQKYTQHYMDMSRPAAISIGWTKFSGYEECHKILIHAFYEHHWAGGFGGWPWGNIVHLTNNLYKALKTDKTDQILIALDRIMQVQHNNGTALKSKFSWYSVDIYLLYRILWAKRCGYACCYKTLEDISNMKPDPSFCTHAISISAMTKQKPLIKKEYIYYGSCGRCGKGRTWAEVGEEGFCIKNVCGLCGSCACARIRNDGKCLRCETPLPEGTCECPYKCLKCEQCANLKHSFCHRCFRTIPPKLKACPICNTPRSLLIYGVVPEVQPKWKKPRKEKEVTDGSKLVVAV